jgi:hypothetical protein
MKAMHVSESPFIYNHEYVMITCNWYVNGKNNLLNYSVEYLREK